MRSEPLKTQIFSFSFCLRPGPGARSKSEDSDLNPVPRPGFFHLLLRFSLIPLLLRSSILLLVFLSFDVFYFINCSFILFFFMSLRWEKVITCASRCSFFLFLVLPDRCNKDLCPDSWSKTWLFILISKQYRKLRPELVLLILLFTCGCKSNSDFKLASINSAITSTINFGFILERLLLFQHSGCCVLNFTLYL